MSQKACEWGEGVSWIETSSRVPTLIELLVVIAIIRGLDRPALARGTVGPGGQPDEPSAPTTSSKSAWPAHSYHSSHGSFPPGGDAAAYSPSYPKGYGDGVGWKRPWSAAPSCWATSRADAALQLGNFYWCVGAPNRGLEHRSTVSRIVSATFICPSDGLAPDQPPGWRVDGRDEQLFRLPGNGFATTAYGGNSPYNGQASSKFGAAASPARVVMVRHHGCLYRWQLPQHHQHQRRDLEYDRVRWKHSLATTRYRSRNGGMAPDLPAPHVRPTNRSMARWVVMTSPWFRSRRS